MSALLEIRGLVKDYQGLRPLRIRELTVTPDTIMSIAQKVGIAQGGTDVGAPIKHMIRERIKADVFIGITDNVDWAGDGFLTNLEEYRSKVNKNLKCFLMTIAPYRDGLAPMNYEDVYCTYGWSDAILKYIALILAGGVGQVDDVKAIDLDTFGQKAKAEEVEAVSAD